MIELEKENLGKPKCTKIEINPEKASETIPQAWENKGNWYYNWEGAMAECDFLKKRMPNKAEWIEITKKFGSDGKKLSKELGLPFAGYRYRSTGNYSLQSTTAYYWSSSPNASNGYYLYFSTGNINPANHNYRANGFSVRCIKN